MPASQVARTALGEEDDGEARLATDDIEENVQDEQPGRSNETIRPSTSRVHEYGSAAGLLLALGRELVLG